MGVSTTPSISGVRTGPPAAREWAVDPVGVDMINPSPAIFNSRPISKVSSMYTILGLSPRVITASFKASIDSASPAGGVTLSMVLTEML